MNTRKVAGRRLMAAWRTDLDETTRQLDILYVNNEQMRVLSGWLVLRGSSWARFAVTGQMRLPTIALWPTIRMGSMRRRIMRIARSGAGFVLLHSIERVFERIRSCKQAVVQNWYIFCGIKEELCVCMLWG